MLKSLSSVGEFVGTEEKWPDWFLGFRSYLCLTGLVNAEQLEAVEQSPTTINMNELGPEWKQRAQSLWHMLVLILKGPGKPLAILRKTETTDGLEAWRQICLRYDGKDAIVSTGLLQRLLDFKFGGNLERLKDRLLIWDVELAKYNRLNPVDEIPDNILRTILMKGSPEPLKTTFN